MKTVYFRLILDTHNPEDHAQIHLQFSRILEESGIRIHAPLTIMPYWKNENLCEMTFHCESALSLPGIQQLFADIWQADTADIRWSHIRVSHVSFLWISH